MKHTFSQLSEFWESMKNFPQKIPSAISYPQYLLFFLEIALVIFFFSIIDHKTVLDYGIFFSWCLLSLVNLYRQRDFSCGSFNEQIKGNKTKGKELETSNPKEAKILIPIGIRAFFSIIIISSINNIYIDVFLSLFVSALSVCEIMIYLKKVSPFLLFPLIFSFSIIVYAIGIDKTIINWTLLLLLFGTTIGANFFDMKLLKGRIPDDIDDKSEGNLILRKISFYIGLVFLYIGLTISDKVINSTTYYILTASEQPFNKIIIDIITKSFIFMIVFATYWGTQNKILYWIFSFYYRDKGLKCRSNLAKVVLEKGIWRVVEEDIQQDFLNLKTISIDTYQIEEENRYTDCVAQKSETSEQIEEDNRYTDCVAQGSETSEQIEEDNRYTYYIAQESEIPEKIDGLPASAGYSILGVIDSFTIIFATLAICILPFLYFSDFKVKIDDGIYTIEEKPDKAEVPNEIEVLGDAIVYNGKVEAFDTHTQSFEHGTILIRKKDKHSIELTKNVGDKTKVVYQKMDANGIPIKLQEKYTGHSKKPGYDGLIFSEGNSTLIFDKKDNKITNKTEKQKKPFVVIPEDKLDGEAKVAFNKHKSEYKGAHFIFTANKKYDKDSSKVYVAVLSDGGKTIQINELEYNGKDDDYLYRFTGKAE